MRVKVCGIKTEQELETAVSAGADAVGFLVGQVHASHDFILASTAARLVRMLPPYVVPVLVTHLTKPETILELAEQTSIFTIQLPSLSPNPPQSVLASPLCYPLHA